MIIDAPVDLGISYETYLAQGAKALRWRLYRRAIKKFEGAYATARTAHERAEAALLLGKVWALRRRFAYSEKYFDYAIHLATEHEATELLGRLYHELAISEQAEARLSRSPDREELELAAETHLALSQRQAA